MQVRSLPTELQRKAEKEINEVADRVEDDLKCILEWLEKESHLNVRKDDQWLVTFLRGCKFSLQQTKEKLDYFYTMRTLVPEIFSSRDSFSAHLQEFLKNGMFLPLPLTNGSDGYRVILIRFKDTDYNAIPVASTMKMMTMIMDILMVEDDNAAVAGIMFIIDQEGFPFHYMLQLTPSFIQKCVLCIQSAYPLRIKGIYYANAPSFFEVAFKIASNFMNAKLRSRVRLYSSGNFNKIFNDVPQSLLPKEYGGEGGTIEELTTKWKTKVESYKDWFLEDTKYCSNESLRRGKPKTSAEIFGVEGSFRKLTID